MRAKLVARVAVSAVTLAVSASCANSLRSTPAPRLTGLDGQTVSATAKIDPASGQITLPIDALLPSATQLHTVEFAQDLVMLSCVRTAGERYEVVDRRKDPPTVSRRYGLWAPSNPGGFAYTTPPASAGTRRLEALNAQVAPPRRAEILAGCRQRTEMRTLSFDTVALQTAAMDLYNATLASAEGRAVVADWRACLRQRGVSDQPVDPGSPFVPAGVTFTRSARETALAVVDVACKVKTDLVRRLADLEAQRQWDFLTENTESLRAHVDRLRSVLHAADAVIRSAALDAGPGRPSSA